MNWLNSLAFDVGLALFICFFVQNLFMIILCILFRIHIDKYAVIANYGRKYIYRTNINGTQLVLGFLPYGNYIRLRQETFDLKDEDSSILHKPMWQQRLIEASICIGFLLFFFVLLFFVNPSQSFSSNLQNVLTFAISAFKAMFNDAAKAAFIKTAPVFFATTKALPTILCLLCLFNLLYQPFLFLTERIGAKGVKSRFVNIAIILYLLFCCYLAAWEIPQLIMQFYSSNEFWLGLGNVLLGIYVAGVLCYFVIVALFKYVFSKYLPS